MVSSPHPDLFHFLMKTVTMLTSLRRASLLEDKEMDFGSMPCRSQALAGAFLKMKMSFSSQVINMFCAKQHWFAVLPPHPLFLFSSQEEGEVDTQAGYLIAVPST